MSFAASVSVCVLQRRHRVMHTMMGVSATVAEEGEDEDKGGSEVY
jgi:hypothetical protein